MGDHLTLLETVANLGVATFVIGLGGLPQTQFATVSTTDAAVGHLGVQFGRRMLECRIVRK